MLNFRLLVAGIALTVMSGYVVVNMDNEAEACCYYMSIDAPDDNIVFYEFDTIDVEVEWNLPGDPYASLDVTAELQCSLTNRLEDDDLYSGFIGDSAATFLFEVPESSIPDFGEAFCIVVSGGGYEDRVNVTFIPYCSCCCCCCP